MILAMWDARVMDTDRLFVVANSEAHNRRCYVICNSQALDVISKFSDTSLFLYEYSLTTHSTASMILKWVSEVENSSQNT